MDCTVGTLSYLDDFGTPHDLENTLNSKLTVEGRVTPAYYANNRKITLGCDAFNCAYINFNYNNRDSGNTLYACEIFSQSGISGTPGSSTLTLHCKTAFLKGGY